MPVPPVPYDSPAVERGFGFFETVLLAGRRAVLWEAHSHRLLGTLAKLELPAPEPGQLRAAATAVLDEAGIAGGPGRPEKALRLSWIAVGADVEAFSSWRLDVSIREIPASTLGRRAGARAVSLPHDLYRDSPGFKTTSYFAAVAGLRWAKKHGGDEGLFRAPDGSYHEGTSTALVAWNGGRLAGCGPGALPSVSAEAFLAGSGERRSVTEAEIRAGALILGSLTRAVPILTLDDLPCDVPAGLRDACDAFNARLATEPSFFVEL